MSPVTIEFSKESRRVVLMVYLRPVKLLLITPIIKGESTRELSHQECEQMRGISCQCCFGEKLLKIQKMLDYRRLSSELREAVRMRDGYINELQICDNYDEVLESIEIIKSTPLDDTEKASRLILMAREIQTKVHEKNKLIMRLRLD
nr:hypothetical protein [Tanacetum cinerariifolium]